MFRLRRIYYDESEDIQGIFNQIRRIMKDHFSRLTENELDMIFDQFKNPLKINFQTLVFIAENGKGKVNGFAIVLYEPNINFFYLDYIAVAKRLRGRGIGGALYQRVQEEARSFDVVGIFCDVYTDNSRFFKDPKKLKENQRRLKFYESYGSYPIINTKYENIEDSDAYPCFLLYDNLGNGRTLARDYARVAVKALLDRRYGNVSPVQYVQNVLESIVEDPVSLRPPKYVKKKPLDYSTIEPVSENKKIGVVFNELHDKHNISTKGYFEIPVRVNIISKELKKHPYFKFLIPREYPYDILKSVHQAEYVNYLKEISKIIPKRKQIYPEVFPIRNQARPPKDLINRVGYYSMDTSTPLTGNIFNIAHRAVECALTAAEVVKKSKGVVYALIRPPGHHAETRLFGGYCYFNNTAIAANFLSKHGRVAILDIDYHHGNGTQEIFYERSDVLTISIHGDPNYEYPFFSGFTDELGEGDGKGYNLNIPLQENTDGSLYLHALNTAIEKITSFNPDYLVVALGFDTAKRDPTGTWLLEPQDFRSIGSVIGHLKLPTVIVQEGGYLINSLAMNAINFFEGIWHNFFE